MKKAIYKNTGMAYDFSELKKEEQIGFDSEYLWKAVSYFGSPKYSGKYLVIQKKWVYGEQEWMVFYILMENIYF